MPNDRKEYMKQFRLEHREETKEYNKQYHIKNREERKEYCKQWRKDNSGHIEQYCIKHKEYRKKYMKQYYIDHKEKEDKYSRQYRIDNKEKIIEYMKKYKNNRYKTDLKFNFNHKISEAIRKSLIRNKAGYHWETLVGYTYNDLINRLKDTMPKGYNWQNYMDGKLHIDHITPVSAHNFTKPEHTDFKRCWALSNLRLLSAKENRIKSNHLENPFQPALKI